MYIYMGMLSLYHLVVIYIYMITIKDIRGMRLLSYTIWLFNIAMENPTNKWRFRSLGKSSISMGHFPWQTVK